MLDKKNLKVSPMSFLVILFHIPDIFTITFISLLTLKVLQSLQVSFIEDCVNCCDNLFSILKFENFVLNFKKMFFSISLIFSINFLFSFLSKNVILILSKYFSM